MRLLVDEEVESGRGGTSLTTGNDAEDDSCPAPEFDRLRSPWPFVELKRAPKPGATGLRMLPVLGFGKGGRTLSLKALIERGVSGTSSSIGFTGGIDNDETESGVEGVLSISSVSVVH